jgi:hypothetical protein
VSPVCRCSEWGLTSDRQAWRSDGPQMARQDRMRSSYPSSFPRIEESANLRTPPPTDGRNTERRAARRDRRNEGIAPAAGGLTLGSKKRDPAGKEDGGVIVRMSRPIAGPGLRKIVLVSPPSDPLTRR